MNDQEASARSEQLVYSLGRADWLGGWWSWALACFLVALVFYLSLKLYRRDTVETDRPTRWTLMLLRIAVLSGLVLFFLNLERRAQQRVQRPSEVAILIDTSQSMSLPQEDLRGGRSRIEAAREIIAQSPLVEDLAKSHRVSVYTFDSTGELREVVVSALQDHQETAAEGPSPGTALSGENHASLLAMIGAAVLVVALIGMLLAAAMQWFFRSARASAVLFAATIAMLGGGLLLGIQWTTKSTVSLAALLGLEVASPGAPLKEAAENPPPENAPILSTRQRLDAVRWDDMLVASGEESRLGDALRATLARHDPSTLGAVLLLTDGQSNAGVSPLVVSPLAARDGIAIYPLGFGSDKRPVNARIVDLDVPSRVYPGDKFSIQAVLQGSGNDPLTVQVQLIDAEEPATAASPSPSTSGENATVEGGEIIDSREVVISPDGTLENVQFEIKPSIVGRRRLTVRLVPPAEDQNETDNVRQARYEVVSRRLRVLLLAGGPLREYLFVRNLFFRDPSIELDVLLQTGQRGISQDAERILTSFPATAAELYEYDAIVAFDPDWLQLDAVQIDLLDKWISQQAGGLMLVSGPVHLPQWSAQRTEPRVGMLRNLFPVVLPTRGPLLTSGRVGGESILELKLSLDAARAAFLQLTDDPQSSRQAWQDFSGVYDYLGVYEAKPGAKTYGTLVEPSAMIDGKEPVYLASQFYGAGRVFYQGSGEMWRIRGVSDTFFDAYYTKLIRWISEGRLLRDSNRGLLLVDRPRALVGDTIVVRAILTDPQFEPLRVPQVQAQLLTPSGRIEAIRLTPLEGEPREGTYAGRVLARESGTFEVRLTLGDALDEQVLRQSFQVGLPTLELERPQRNDEVLMALAATTGGLYVPLGGTAQSSEDESVSAKLRAIPDAIVPQPQVTILPGTPDRDFQQRRNATFMWLLCSMLTMEWMIRRFHRLA